jgi:hypothetical protein
MTSRGALLLLSAAAAAVVATFAWRLSSARELPRAVSASPKVERSRAASGSEEALVAVDPERRHTPGDRQSALDAESAPPATGEPAALADAVQWLQRIMPDEFGELTASEVAALTELDLRGTDVTDADLARLASLENLRVLGLRGTKVTDAGLVHLSGLELSSLDLRGTQITALGLGYLPARSLEALHLTDTKVAGAELVRLPPMPRLAVLKLNSLELEDAAIESLCLYPLLRHIELDQTAISDKGLRRLLVLNPDLTRIELRDTSVSPETVAELVERYPACTFVQASHFINGNPIHSGAGGF